MYDDEYAGLNVIVNQRNSLLVPAILQLKKDKSAGAISLTTKHVIYFDDICVKIPNQLSSICSKHGYVQSVFIHYYCTCYQNTAIKSDVIDNHRPIFSDHDFY